jgi:TetR/AcrR family transcriptional repressor of nem operon
MLVNSALEASPENAELRDAIANELRLIEGFFRDCLIAGQARGEISSAHSADDAARQLLAVLLGIRVLARVRPERALLVGAVRPTLKILGLPPLTTAGGTAKSSRRRS